MVLTALSGCGRPDIKHEHANQVEYPAWFYNPPQISGQQFAVGFCQPCMNIDSSIELARLDAIWQILGMEEVRINMKSGVTGLDTTYMHLGYNVGLEVDSSRFKNISENFRVFEKFYANQALVVLVGPKGNSDYSGKISDSDWGEWWREIPHDNTYFYSVGAAPEYYYETSSWQRAMGNALLKLVEQLSLDINAYKKYDGRTVRKTYVEENDVVLSNWEIIARHYSSSNRTYHVLIRMSKNGG